MKNFISILALIILWTTTIAQQVSTNVDYYTGTANVNLPLGTYETGGYTLPISLGYTASGIRVSQTASWVGLGWELNAGGFITREIRNLPDDVYVEDGAGVDFGEKGWLYWNDYRDTTSWFQKVQSLTPNLSCREHRNWSNVSCLRGDNGYIHDAEPDIFSVNVPGLSASFIFEPGDSAQQPGNREVLLLGDENIKIDYTLSSSTYEIESFTVIDENGTKYVFSQQELSISNSATIITDTLMYVKYSTYRKNGLGVQGNGVSNASNYSRMPGVKVLNNQVLSNTREVLTYRIGAEKDEVMSSWFLSKIITPTNHEINFTYRDEWIQLDESSYKRFKKTSDGYSSPIAYVKSNFVDNGFVPLLKTKKINCITSDQFKIDFIADTIREDLDDENIDTGYEPKRLDQIKAYSNVNGNYLQKKVYTFKYEYAVDGLSNNYYDKRLLLDELKISNDSLTLPAYTFNYIDDADLPSRYSNAQDFWGFYNYETSNTTLVPKIYVYKNLAGSDRFRLFNVESTDSPYDVEYELAGANRLPEHEAVLTGTLEKVTYPSGGYVEFEFEPNWFTYENASASQNDLCQGPGIRIKKKTESDGLSSNNNIVEEYVYTSGGKLNAMPKFGYFDPVSWPTNPDYYNQAYYDEHYIRTNKDLSKSVDGHIFYEEVQIKMSGKGKQVISYESAPHFFSDPDDFDYFDIPELYKIREQEDQDTNYNRQPNMTGVDLTLMAYPYLYNNNYSWNRGLVKEIKEYNASNVLLKKTENHYIDYYRNGSGPLQVSGAMIDYIWNNAKNYSSNSELTKPLILCGKYTINTGVGKRVDSTKVTTYDDENSSKYIIAETFLKYNEYGQLIEKESPNSDGTKSIIRYRYPLDFSYLSSPYPYPIGTSEYTAGISEMVHQNKLNAPIETISIIKKENSNDTIRYIKSAELNLPQLNIVNSSVIPLQEISLVYHLDTLQLETNYVYCDINTSGGFTSLSANWDTIAEVGQYDAYGNMLDMYTKNGTPNAIHWGYDSSFKIAEISNASYAETGYTGFEYGELHGWTFSSGITTEFQAIPIGGSYDCRKAIGGDYTAKSTGGSVSRYFKTSDIGSNFDTEAGYKASVWVKGSESGTLTMKIYSGSSAEKTIQATSTSGDTTWQLLELHLTKEDFDLCTNGVDSIYVEVDYDGSQTLYIDELRFYPGDALMTTYSHKPGFGIISQAGPNNIFTYFYYDYLSRVSWVRNHDGDIITHKEYVVNNNLPTNGPSSILVRNVLKEGITTVLDATELQSGDVLETYEYLDGFARTIQTVRKGFSPNHKDFINLSVFNKYGEQDKLYLPYASSDENDGSYKSNAISEIYDFYSTSGSKVAYSNFPYAEIDYSSSPNSYVEEQGSFGFDWQITQGNTKQFDFTFNNSNEVVWFRYDMDDEDVDTKTGEVYYPANELSINEITDENANVSLSYTDKSGKTIATKRDMGEDELWTYFVYDDFGQLVFKITPKAFAEMVSSPVDYSFSWSSDIFKDLIYGYKYDAKGRITESKVPGKSVEYFVYDNLNRPIMYQDGNLRQNDEWKVTKYDVHGRIVMTAIENFASTKSQSSMQGDADNHYSSSINKNYEYFSGVTAGSPHGYTKRSFPTNVDNDDILTVNYFDQYDFDKNIDVSFTSESELSLTSYTDKTIGLATGSKVRILDSSPVTWLLSATYYDDLQRVVQSVSENNLGGYDRISSKLYFSGWVSRSNHTHNDGTNSIVERRYYSYDHAGRLRKLNYDIDEGTTFTMYQHKFNELGQVIEKNLHGDIEEQTFWQSIDYKYNIRGWLTNINNSNYTNSNSIIDFDQYLNSNEVVDGLVYDTLALSISSSDSTRIRIYFDDSKYFQIANLSNPSLDRNLQYNETEYTTLYNGETPQGEFDIFKEYIGDDFVFVFDSLHIAENWHMQDITDSIGNMIEDQLSSQGVTDEDEITEFVNKVKWYISERIALVYFNEDSDDLYGMDILYNEGLADLSGDIQYNGLVSGIRWQSQFFDGIRGYGYVYDEAYRMKDANYGLWDNGWDSENRYGVNNITYDENGNIKTLERNGQVAADGSGSFGLIDDLTYTYDGNLLTSVDDVRSNTYAVNDFEDNSSQTVNEYAYDYNGNLYKDDNKGIDTIKYNHLNLPKEILFDATHKISYIYDASGNKLKKTVISGQNSIVTDYVSNMIYVDNELQMVLTEEGRMLPQTTGGYRAEYFLKDHLGNNRVTITDTDSDGDAEVVQEDHFYPYGMTMSGLSYTSGTKNDFLYQGKEQQDELNLYWYDFGARMFDQQLGRWHVADPMLQYHSPYVGIGNRPSGGIDPSGMWTREAYMSDVTGFDAYRLSKYRAFHNYNRETNVLGKSKAQEHFDRIAGQMEIERRNAYENSIENIITGISNYAGVEASSSIIAKSLISQITAALEKLQDEKKVQEENSIENITDDGGVCMGCPPPNDLFQPVDITQKDAMGQLLVALSYANDYLHDRLPENESKRWKDKPLTFGDLFDYSKFDKRFNWDAYFTETWTFSSSDLEIKITLFASRGNTVHDLLSNSSNVIKLRYPYNRGGESTRGKQGLRIEFLNDYDDYQSGTFTPNMFNSFWKYY